MEKQTINVEIIMEGRGALRFPIVTEFENEEYRKEALLKAKDNLEKELNEPNDFGFVRIVATDGSTMSVRPEKIVAVSYDK